jgi:hypothetical protein
LLRLIGLLVRVVLAGAVLTAIALVGLAIVPAPGACTPDVAPTGGSDVFVRWAGFVRGAAPGQVRFSEAEVTAALEQTRASTNLPITDLHVHFCADGTAQLAFTYRWDPVSAHGLATGTIAAASPLHLQIAHLVVGGLPVAVTDPALDAVRAFLDPVTSLSLEGPIDRVEIIQGWIVIFND